MTEHYYDLDMLPKLFVECRYAAFVLRQLAHDSDSTGIASAIRHTADDLERAMDDVSHCPTVAERGTW